jgi:hypothetical protein
MKNICFINGSPRQLNASSLHLINELRKIIGEESFNLSTIQARKTTAINNDFAAILKADALIIAFPLYYYALPGLLLQFLEEYYKYAKTKQINPATNVYAIINCGFPEASHNQHAAKIIENFCRKLGLTWRFAVKIGGGGIIQQNMPLQSFLKRNIYKSLDAISLDIKDCKPTSSQNLLINTVFPKWLYLWFATQGWLETAKINGLTKQDLNQAPYA